MASASDAKRRRSGGGKFCVAGGPGQVSCTNSQFTEGISVHSFPDIKDARRAEWVRFVRRHRPNFNASKSSVLCSAHFHPSSFTINLDIAASLGMKRILRNDAVPTIDIAGNMPSTSGQVSDRERRQVR